MVVEKLFLLLNFCFFYMFMSLRNFGDMQLAKNMPKSQSSLKLLPWAEEKYFDYNYNLHSIVYLELFFVAI